MFQKIQQIDLAIGKCILNRVKEVVKYCNDREFPLVHIFVKLQKKNQLLFFKKSIKTDSAPGNAVRNPGA